MNQSEGPLCARLILVTCRGDECTDVQAFDSRPAANAGERAARTKERAIRLGERRAGVISLAFDYAIYTCNIPLADRAKCALCNPGKETAA